MCSQYREGEDTTSKDTELKMVPMAVAHVLPFQHSLKGDAD